uniref:MYND-type domain-containing protein n=1 Tax=Anopheles farauti TaxID=69004 RepID=A0A182Q6M6_9DIPT
MSINMEQQQGTDNPKCKRCEIFREMNRNLVKSGFPPPLIRAAAATSEVKDKPVQLRLDQLLRYELPETFFSGDLQAQVDVQDGQLMAKKSIESAQVIAIVKPFMWTTAGISYERCDFCLQNKPLTLIPCSGGCQLVMYCHVRCQEMAWKNYHKLECAVMKELCREEAMDCILAVLRYTG